MIREHQVAIDYTNYEGRRSTRVIIPSELHYGSNRWHPEPQWLVLAYDVVKDGFREFAMKDIHRWVPSGNGDTDRG